MQAQTDLATHTLDVVPVFQFCTPFDRAILIFKILILKHFYDQDLEDQDGPVQGFVKLEH